MVTTDTPSHADTRKCFVYAGDRAPENHTNVIKTIIVFTATRLDGFSVMAFRRTPVTRRHPASPRCLYRAGQVIDAVEITVVRS